MIFLAFAIGAPIRKLQSRLLASQQSRSLASFKSAAPDLLSSEIDLICQQGFICPNGRWGAGSLNIFYVPFISFRRQSTRQLHQLHWPNSSLTEPCLFVWIEFRPPKFGGSLDSSPSRSSCEAAKLLTPTKFCPSLSTKEVASCGLQAHFPLKVRWQTESRPPIP